MQKLTFIFVAGLIPVLGLSQRIEVAPVPPDPLELVTDGAKAFTTFEQREPLIAVVNRAASYYSLHAKSNPAYILDTSFHATASTLFAGGEGHLRETWISGGNWRLDASLATYSLVRISSNGVAYDQQAPSPIPMRLKMLYNAIYAPIEPKRVESNEQKLRFASVTWKGRAEGCVLMSPRITQTGRTGARAWNEVEYCIDPATGLLDIYSEAPGIYVAYNYGKALRFHGKVLPGRVTITENGATVLDAQLNSIVETGASDAGALTPTAQMMAQGPAPVLLAPVRPWVWVWSSEVRASSTIEPTIVHAILDDQGNVQESEVLQGWSSAAKALAHIAKKNPFEALKPDGGRPREREAFLEVQFRPEL